jgi:diguanylate cyclase (GGDEF)-like protein/PAS domain S-box-containing protein
VKHINPPELGHPQWGRAAQWLPGLVLVLGLLVTFVLQKNALLDAHEAQQLSFDSQTQDITQRIEQRMASYEQVLRGARGLLEASEEVARPEFASYVASLHLGEHYPGIQGIGFSPLIPAQTKASALQRIRQHDLPDYAIHPAGERPVYAPVLFIEPFSGSNLRAVGYDVYSEPVRRTAMDRARDTDSAAITGKVILAQETENSTPAGFLMYFPVYSKFLPHQTLTERRAHIKGWVSAPFRMGDLMRGILGPQINQIDLEIFDGGSASEPTLMVDTDGKLSLHQAHAAKFQSLQQILVSGHAWTLKMSARPSFDASHPTERVTELRLLGLLMSSLLACLVWLQVSARGRAIRLAEQMTQAMRGQTAKLVNTQARLNALINTLPDLVWLKDIDGVYLACNPRFERFFRARKNDIIGKTDYDFVDKALADSFRANDQAALAADGPYTNEEWITFADDGHRELLEVTKTPMRDTNGQVIGVLGISHDITARNSTEAALKKSEAFKLAILNSVPAEIAVIDHQGVILAVNERWQQFSAENGLVPSTPAPLTGVGANYLAAGQDNTGLDADSATHARTGIQAVLDGKLTSFKQEYACHSPDEQRWFTMTVTPLGLEDHVGAVIMHTDFTERKQMENAVHRLAFYDALTLLPNRRLLNDRLKQSMAASNRSGFFGALMFIDLDNFKSLNDTHGHDMGDLLLMEVAQRLNHCVRAMDTVARFGGDEFVVMITELSTDRTESAEQAAAVAEKIRLALAETYRLTLAHEGQTETTVEHHCTASIGVTLFVEHDAQPEDILKWADLAMYMAKDAGRNQVCFYEPD